MTMGVAMSTSLAADRSLMAPFRWTLSEPLLSPVKRPEDPCFSVKDPTAVRHNGRWHVFTTIRSRKRTHQIETVTFRDWPDANQAPRRILRCRDGYFCAPQVFYFTPHRLWYLIYQVGEPGRKLGLQPAYSTTRNIDDPDSWTKAKLLFPERDPASVTGWIDFWVICDRTTAYLFFTSLDGRMWRMRAPMKSFPSGFDRCELALQADIFEASHTYRLKGRTDYLTVVEAQGSEGRRYYQAYLADRLDGEWRPLANMESNPFAGASNVIPRQAGERLWADNISHGELLRDGIDETLTVDPARPAFLIQGATQQEKEGKPYGEIPWRLGLLHPRPSR